MQFGRNEDEPVGRYPGAQRLEQYLSVGRFEEKAASGGRGLSSSAEELVAFKTQFRPKAFVPATFVPGERLRGFVGVDGGSTSTKAVLLSTDGDVLCKAYQLSKGNPIQDTVDMFDEIRAQVEGQGARLDNCLRTFIDIKMGPKPVGAAPSVPVTFHSKVPKADDEVRVIIATCEKGSVEDVASMREIKTAVDAVKKANPNFVEIASKEVFNVKHAKRKLDYLFFPMVDTLHTPLTHLAGSCACPTVTVTPDTAKAAFIKETNVFTDHAVRYLNPMVNFTDRKLLCRQLFETWYEALGLSEEENERAVDVGFKGLAAYEADIRGRAREALDLLERENRLGIVVLARPYHHDPGLNNEEELPAPLLLDPQPHRRLLLQRRARHQVACQAGRPRLPGCDWYVRVNLQPSGRFDERQSVDRFQGADAASNLRRGSSCGPKPRHLSQIPTS